MAITSLSVPTVPISSWMPIIFQVLSDSSDITTEIQAKIYYRRNAAEFYTLAATQMQQKKHSTTYFEFNVSNVCDKLLTADYATGSTAITTNAINSSIEIVLIYTEYYPSSSFAAHDTFTSSSYVVTNTKLYATETQSIASGSTYFMDSAPATKKFLTDSPSTAPIRANERIQLGFLCHYTDPAIKVRETKIDLSTNTTEYEIPNYTLSPYLWNWSVNASNIVSIIPRVVTSEPQITDIGAGGTYVYIADGTTMYGGIKQIKDEKVDILLPVISVISAVINIRIRSYTGTTTYDIYYYYSGSWHASTLGTQSVNTGWATFSQTLPSGTSSVRIAAYDQNCYIAWGKVIYTNDNTVNNRCQFTLDTTHIDTDTLKLQIWATNTASGTAMSEVKTYLVDANPVYQDTTRFAVKNKRGEFDHFTYTQGHSEILTVEKIRSTKELPNTFTTKDRGLSVNRVISEKIFTCYSDYIEDSNLQWWATIIESDEVYVIIADIQYAVDIITSSLISYTHSDLVQLKIDWTYAYKR